jgi:hypothetical protein
VSISLLYSDVHIPTPLRLGFLCYSLFLSFSFYLLLMLLLLFGTVFFSCFVVLVSFLRRELLPWRAYVVSHPGLNNDRISAAQHLRRSARLPVLSMKVDLMFVRCVCVPNLLYMCEYINFYGGGGTPQLPTGWAFKGL